MKNRVPAFIEADDGAVTVDWVVLTAAIVGLGMVVLVPVAFSTENAATFTADLIRNIQVGYE